MQFQINTSDWLVHVQSIGNGNIAINAEYDSLVMNYNQTKEFVQKLNEILPTLEKEYLKNTKGG